jgi:hypothetical protein
MPGMFEPVAIAFLPVVAAVSAYGCFERLEVGRTLHAGRCSHCKYALDCLPHQGACPECGRAFDKSERTFAIVRAFSLGRMKNVAILLAITCVVPLAHPLSELVWFLGHGYGAQSLRLAYVWAPRNGGSPPAGLVAPTALFLCGVLLVGVVRFWRLIAGYLTAAAALIGIDMITAGHADAAVGLPAFLIVVVVLLGLAGESHFRHSRW